MIFFISCDEKLSKIIDPKNMTYSKFGYNVFYSILSHQNQRDTCNCRMAKDI